MAAHKNEPEHGTSSHKNGHKLNGHKLTDPQLSGQNAAQKAGEALKKAVEHQQKGDLSAAKKHYLIVLEYHPSNFMAHHYLGVIYDQNGDHQRAISHLQSAVKSKPDHGASWLKLGQILLNTARPENRQAGLDAADNALKIGQASLTQSPATADKTKLFLSQIHNTIGGAHSQIGDYHTAKPIFEKSLQFNPGNAQAWNNLGVCLRYMGDYQTAIKSFDMAKQLMPDYINAQINLLDLYVFLGQADHYLAEYSALVSRHKTYLKPSQYSNYLMAMHYASDIDMDDIFAAQCGWGDQFANHLKKLTPQSKPNASHDDAKRPPIRVGFMSTSFRAHPVGYLARAALGQLDKRHFSCYFYSDGAGDKYDDITAAIKQNADYWRDIGPLTDQDVISQILKDDLDILFDLSGHSENGRLYLFGHHLAPVQTTWVGGLFGSTGLADMDWILADHIEIPPSHEKWYREKIYRMPDDYICYTPPDYMPAPSPLPAQKNGYITFGAVNTGSKNNQYSLQLWADILNQIPNARLVIKNKIYQNTYVQDYIRAQMTPLLAHGADDFDPRISLIGGHEHSTHLQYLADHIDIALDPVPYTGGLTTCENMMIGIPTITWPRDHFASRHSATHLTNAGMAQFIATSRDDYIAKAIHWANHIDDLADLRQSLPGQVLSSPLTDANLFAKNIERAIIDMISAS